MAKSTSRAGPYGLQYGRWGPGDGGPRGVNLLALAIKEIERKGVCVWTFWRAIYFWDASPPNQTLILAFM